MHFLRVNVTFYDSINMIHDVIWTANPVPYTAKFMFVCVRNNRTKKEKQMFKDRYNTYIVLQYNKYILLGWEK